LTEFYKNKAQWDGLSVQCKACCKSNAAQRRIDKPEVTREEVRQAWKRNGREYEAVRRDTKRKYRAENAETLKKYFEVYRKANRPKVAANRAKARAARKLATPSWANQSYIALFYEMAKLESERISVPVEVDHIVPLQSDIVCGLHCEHNLQLLSAYDNRAKGNRVWPDMP
jgi:hypothetical protein